MCEAVACDPPPLLQLLFNRRRTSGTCRHIQTSRRSSAAAAPDLASTLWRALLASARRYDKEPALRSLLATARTAEHDITSGAWAEAERPALGDLQSAEEVAQRVAEHAVHRLCDGGRVYVPGKSDGADRRAVAAVRDAARSARDGAPSHLLVDAGSALLRMLEAPVRLVGSLFVVVCVVWKE